MTIELNTLTHMYTNPHRQTDRRKDRPIVEASKREEIISKQNKKKATTTSIEDSFMDFNVSFRS